MRKLLLRVSEAAKMASVGRTTAYQMVASGLWPSVRVGAGKTGIRVPLVGLRAWIDDQSRYAPAGVSQVKTMEDGMSNPISVQPSPFTEAQAASLAVAYKLILASRRQREAQADERQKEDATRT